MNQLSSDQRIADLEKRIKIIEDQLCTKKPLSVNLESKISLTEFLREKKPSDDVKKTLAIGYYLQCSEGVGKFNVKDLGKGFQRARETKPLNLSDKVNMAIRNGYLDEDAEKKDHKKAWHLTDSGIKFVENGFKK